MVPFAHLGTLLPLLFPMSLFGRDSHTHTHFSRLRSEVSERPDLPKASNDFSHCLVPVQGQGLDLSEQ